MNRRIKGPVIDEHFLSSIERAQRQYERTQRPEENKERFYETLETIVDLYDRKEYREAKQEAKDLIRTFSEEWQGDIYGSLKDISSLITRKRQSDANLKSYR